MSGTTSVPAITFGPQGPVAPAEQDILTGLLADTNAAFGGNMNTALTTPQGQLCQSQAAVIGDQNDQLLALFAGFDPATSSGRAQDAIGRLYFLTRNPAEPTTIQVTISGKTGVTIPVGATVQAADGNLFAATAGGTIPAMGTIVLPFACKATGAIACPAQILTPYPAINGWDSATTLADGVLGSPVESPSAFEARRSQSVAINSIGSLGSIYGSVLAVPGVLDAIVTENATNASVTTGGVTLAPNSLYVCVAGGAPLAVATAIWKKKPPGAAYNGGTTQTVTDTLSGIGYPVSFDIAASTPVYFLVTITTSASVPSDAETQIANAIINAFSGADGGSRARIGSKIYASRFYAGIASLGAWAQIIAIDVGLSSPAAANFVQMQINQVPTFSAADLQVAFA